MTQKKLTSTSFSIFLAIVWFFCGYLLLYAQQWELMPTTLYYLIYLSVPLIYLFVRYKKANLIFKIWIGIIVGYIFPTLMAISYFMSDNIFDLLYLNPFYLIYSIILPIQRFEECSRGFLCLLPDYMLFASWGITGGILVYLVYKINSKFNDKA